METLIKNEKKAMEVAMGEEIGRLEKELNGTKKAVS